MPVHFLDRCDIKKILNEECTTWVRLHGPLYFVCGNIALLLCSKLVTTEAC